MCYLVYLGLLIPRPSLCLHGLLLFTRLTWAVRSCVDVQDMLEYLTIGFLMVASILKLITTILIISKHGIKALKDDSCTTAELFDVKG